MIKKSNNIRPFYGFSVTVAVLAILVSSSSCDLLLSALGLDQKSTVETPALYEYINGVRSDTKLEIGQYESSLEYRLRDLSFEIVSGTSGATIYYTLDGSAPTTSSTRYTGLITVAREVGKPKAVIVRAIAVKSGMNDSAISPSLPVEVTFPIATTSGIFVENGKVYMSGAQDPGLPGVFPSSVYWSDGVLHNLIPPGYGTYQTGTVGSTSISVADGDVYVSGIDVWQGLAFPTYWLNGQRVWGGGQWGSGATSIAVSGGVVYVAAMDSNYFAAYWDSQSSGWTHFSGMDDVNSISVENGVVYAAGVKETYNGFQAWGATGTTEVELDPGESSYAMSVYASNSVAYVAGWHAPPAGNAYVPCYWQDGVKHDLPIPSGYAKGRADSVFVKNDVVYVAGKVFNVHETGDAWYNYEIIEQKACLWVDGVLTELPIPAANASYSYASGVFVTNDSVYVSGGYDAASDNVLIDQPVKTTVPCYWQDEVRHDLPGTELP